VADAFWGNVVLLVHFDGTNGSTSASDVSYKAHALTARNGAVLTTTAGDFKFGTAAASVGGSGACFDTPGSTDFQFGTGDFTVECWLKTSDTDGGLVDYITNGQSGSWQIYIEGNKIAWYAGSTRKLIGSTNVNDGTYHHIALSRSGTTLRAYLDGTLEASTTDSTNYSYATAQLSIGRQNFGSPSTPDDLIGKIDEVRITKGIARYTSNFTAPAAAFDDTPVGSISGNGIASTVSFGTPKIILSAVGFSSTAYGRPTIVFSATGFSSTTFGSPKQVNTATGFSSTTFGTGKVIPNAVGFSTTRVGVPSSPLHATSVASTTAFGSPKLVHAVRGIASTFRSGLQFHPFTQTCVPYPTSTTQFGDATALPFTVGSLNRITSTRGIATTAFGHAAAKRHSTYVASGFTPTAFGTPTLKGGQAAHGVAAAFTAGLPVARQRQAAHGSKTTTFGAPVVRTTYTAAGTGSALAFGLPSITGVRSAHSIRTFTRFGRATASRHALRVTTGNSTTQFGSASAINGHRQLPHSRGTSFGTPLLNRNPGC
jgi:hypothetical protein